MGWRNLKADEIKAFDALVGTGNAASIQLGVDALKAKYENANGYEGRMLSGKRPLILLEIYLRVKHN